MFTDCPQQAQSLGQTYFLDRLVHEADRGQEKGDGNKLDTTTDRTLLLVRDPESAKISPRGLIVNIRPWLRDFFRRLHFSFDVHVLHLGTKPYGDLIMRTIFDWVACVD